MRYGLRRVWYQGWDQGFRKFALAPPTQVDEFMQNVENGKDVPEDPSTDVNADPMAQLMPPPSNPHAPYDLG